MWGLPGTQGSGGYSKEQLSLAAAWSSASDSASCWGHALPP